MNEKTRNTAPLKEKQLRDKLFAIIKNPESYCGAFLKIQDKAGNLIPFKFNAAQKKLLAAIKKQEEAGKPVRIIILKARQMGFSTAVSGLFFHLTVTAKNINTMIIAHKADASGNIFNKNKLFYDELPLKLKPMRRASNAREIIFENPASGEAERKKNPGLRSRIMIETAVNEEAGRGYTIHNLHLSELAFWPHAGRTMTAVMQAVGDKSRVIIESTANGIGGVFYEEWKKAERNENGFEPLFFPWFEDAGNYMEPENGFKLTEDEHELKRRFNLSDGQIMWRRVCLKVKCQGNENIFHQEYPSTPEEAFIASGRPVFDCEIISRAKLEAKKPLQTGRLIDIPGGAPFFQHSRGGYLRVWNEPQTAPALFYFAPLFHQYMQVLSCCFRLMLAGIFPVGAETVIALKGKTLVFTAAFQYLFYCLKGH
jgi:hypothetical protein